MRKVRDGGNVTRLWTRPSSLPAFNFAVVKHKKLVALPFLWVHGSFGKRTVSTLDGALD